jgi:hypothetical protein
MKIFYFSFVILVLVFSCGEKTTSQKTEEVILDSTDYVDEEELVVLHEEELTSYEEDIECVFDTNRFELTVQAIRKYDEKVNVKWNKEKKEALAVLENGDSLILSIGGCMHYGYEASLHTSIKYEDTAALTEKARWLAKTFFGNGIDRKYDAFISKGLFVGTPTNNAGIQKYLLIEDDNDEDSDLFFDGFSFYKQGERTKIMISGYIN